MYVGLSGFRFRASDSGIQVVSMQASAVAPPTVRVRVEGLATPRFMAYFLSSMVYGLYFSVFGFQVSDLGLRVSVFGSRECRRAILAGSSTT